MEDRFPRRLLTGLAVVLTIAVPGVAEASAAAPEPAPIVLVVHGGAGTLGRAEMSQDVEAVYRDKLAEGLLVGFRILRQGGSSLDAVEATIRVFEDSPLFNAGKGAVFTAEGKNELDASIMDGATLRAGAVAAVTNVRHPISAARAVMEQTPHVMLTSRGAETFAAGAGLEIVEPSYFYTERRWQQLEKARAKQRERKSEEAGKEGSPVGTVGAVALDSFGNLAAGTSTGGMTNKRFGRVGDSPIIGAGTYADRGCAVSGTGHGEYFIRYAVAHDICARVTYLGSSIAAAAEAVILQRLTEAGGTGGVIALDAGGNLATPFNTEGMYRGHIRADGVPHVEIFK